MPDSPASVPNLRRKLAEFEEGAKAIRAVLAMLGEDAAESSAARSDTIFQGALKLDAARRNGHSGTPKPKKTYKPYRDIEEARRRETAKRLAAMSTTVPSRYGGGAPALERYGYIKAKGAQGFYVRTNKPYHLTREEREASENGRAVAALRPRVEQPKKKSPGYSTTAAKEARHQEGAAILAKFDRKTARSGIGMGRGPIGNLVRAGYLAKKGDGYIRTAKPYPAHYVPIWERNKAKAATPRAPQQTSLWIAPPKKKTAKPKTVSTNTEKREQRARSAAFLDLFGTTTPTMPPASQYPPGFAKHGLGPLVRRGYLQKVGDGYIRTAKPFSLDAP